MALTTDHKEGRAKVKTVYYTSKTLSDGSHPFLVRITKDRVRKYIATGLSLHPNYWNEQKKEVRRNYPEPQRENLLRELRRWEQKYADAAVSLADADEVHDAGAVASKAIEGRKATRRIGLLSFVDELIQGMRTARQVGNATVYKETRNQLARFVLDQYNTQDISFDRVSVSFCQEWENTLRAIGVGEVTLSLRFRTLRAILNKAIATGVAKADSYPFARNVAERHKFSVGKFDTSTTKRAISRDEVRRIEALQPTKDRLRLAKDVFLFSFYCGGINFVDLAQLRWRNITTESEGKQRLNYIRQKTGGRFSLRLLPFGVATLAQYRPFTFKSPESYVFPILDEKVHKSETQVANRLHKVLGQVNQDLKTLGGLTGITTPLTTYVARHSFATGLKRAGVATGVISEAMGHKTEAVTAVYLDSFATEIVDNAFESLL